MARTRNGRTRRRPHACNEPCPIERGTRILGGKWRGSIDSGCGRYCVASRRSHPRALNTNQIERTRSTGQMIRRSTRMSASGLLVVTNHSQTA